MFAKHRLLAIAAFAALCMLFGQGTLLLAGTTGALNGVVTLQDGSPLSGAKVTASSPSEMVSTTTDTTGHFSFVSLIPDTYTVTATKDNFDAVAQSGVSVFADNTASVHIITQALTRTLGVVTTTATGSLVKPGTTSDVYSINAATQGRVAALGGGGDLDNAYSAIASVPGVVVPPGQGGWFQTIHIRGGDYDQVGYEFDGVPVLRSYDNYPTTNASALGQQELQVYTGAAPANSESQGLAGYINQVIKTGTYPGSATADFGVGTPTLYNKFNIEAGGATPDRNFSYFLGVGMYDQAPRYVNNSNGADVSSQWGIPVGAQACPVAPGTSQLAGGNPNMYTCYASGVGPGGYVFGNYALGAQSHFTDRENVLNLHFGIPHKADAGKDDIQLLLDTSQLYTSYYSSAGDTGLPFTGGQYGYVTSQVYTGQLGVPLPANWASLVQPYGFPSAQSNNGLIPFNKQDGASNGQGIVKLQYQHNMGANAYLRVYGYTFYSDWLENAPNFIFNCCVGQPTDYELSNHTRGVSATFADQLNPKNLLNVEASVIGAQNYRANNTTMFAGASTSIAYLVDASNPKNGFCYNIANLATPVTCSGAATRIKNSTDPATVADPTGLTCGSGPCEYLVVDNGFNGGANKGKPTFTSAAITDQIKPTDKLLVNVGMRYDRYDFKGSNIYQAPGSEAFGSARDFWFSVYNTSFCTPPGVAQTPVIKPGDPSLPCTDVSNFGAGSGYTAAHITPLPDQTESFSVLEPRIGATYTLNSDSVLRFSYGKYAEAPNAAFEQYNVLQQNLAGYDNRFQASGFDTTSRPIRPAVSNNYDLSLEHHFAGTETSFKLTPYYRSTRDQIQNFFLDQKTGFVSGLNAGEQTAAGVEFQLNAGDFSRNGWAGSLSYTYTHSTIKYKPFSNGTTVLDSINQGVAAYNAYTSKCAGNTTNKACGGGIDSAGNVPAACYTTSGTPDSSCAAGDFANPYWNAPAQPLFDVNGAYAPFNTIPGGLDAGAGSYITPNAASLVLNYKHDKWAFTPTFQFFSGGNYGAPFSTAGIDPALGCANTLTGSTTGDPRYPYGAAGGAPFDALTCNGTLGAGIPDRFSGKFDTLGAFKNPNQLLGNLQVSYQATSRVTVVAAVANLINTCFGGQTEPWTISDRRACSYNQPFAAAGVFHPTGNVFNPSSSFQAQAQFPYQPYFGSQGSTNGVQPVAAFFEVQVRL
jgi:hypothetical protein